MAFSFQPIVCFGPRSAVWVVALFASSLDSLGAGDVAGLALLHFLLHEFVHALRPCLRGGF